MKTLILGCGYSRERKIASDNEPDEVITLDLNVHCGPDVLHDLNDPNLPFPDNEFDEIHCYEVLEHVGSQGDFEFFFDQFNEFHRILKPGGVFCGSVPWYENIWAWGDPGHTRILPPVVFAFLQKNMYEQLGDTVASDYRSYINGWWEASGSDAIDDKFYFVLKAI
jgi:SAM-dependent methyltransferase